MGKFQLRLSDSMYASMSVLGQQLDMPMADVIREALSLFAWMANEYESGNTLLIQRGATVKELVIPTLDKFKLAHKEIVPPAK